MDDALWLFLTDPAVAHASADPASQAAVGSVTELLRYGIAGVFIIVLLFMVYTLWKENKSLTNQLAKAQEDRIADVRLCTSALVNAAGAMTASAEGLRGVQTTLTNEFQRRGSR